MKKGKSFMALKFPQWYPRVFEPRIRGLVTPNNEPEAKSWFPGFFEAAGAAIDFWVARISPTPFSNEPSVGTALLMLLGLGEGTWRRGKMKPIRCAEEPDALENWFLVEVAMIGWAFRVLRLEQEKSRDTLRALSPTGKSKKHTIARMVARDTTDVAGLREALVTRRYIEAGRIPVRRGAPLPDLAPAAGRICSLESLCAAEFAERLRGFSIFRADIFERGDCSWDPADDTTEGGVAVLSYFVDAALDREGGVTYRPHDLKRIFAGDPRRRGSKHRPRPARGES